MEPFTCEEREVTLMELLDSREERAGYQRNLLEQHRDAVLVSMMMNIPGPVKSRPEYIRALKAGMADMEKRLVQSGGTIVFRQFRPLVTGSEAFLCVKNLSPMEVKKEALSIEEADSLGRLMDVDVITPQGSISRSEMNVPPRKCLLCDEDAKVCGRSRRHDMGQLLDRISEVLKEYM